MMKPCYPLLDAPENGKRTLIRVGDFVKHISFSCNQGYVLNGESLATCMDGMWTPPAPPTCIKPQ